MAAKNSGGGLHTPNAAGSCCAVKGAGVLVFPVLTGGKSAGGVLAIPAGGRSAGNVFVFPVLDGWRSAAGVLVFGILHRGGGGGEVLAHAFAAPMAEEEDMVVHGSRNRDAHVPCSEPTRRKHPFQCDERGLTGEIVFGIESEWSRTRIHRFI
jgi:hypothetical protein